LEIKDKIKSNSLQPKAVKNTSKSIFCVVF